MESTSSVTSKVMIPALYQPVRTVLEENWYQQRSDFVPVGFLVCTDVPVVPASTARDVPDSEKIEEIKQK